MCAVHVAMMLRCFLSGGIGIFRFAAGIIPLPWKLSSPP